MSSYRYINHTADLGIEVTGKNFKEILTNISKAIFETQISGEVEARTKVNFRLKSESRQDLFIDWCRELLYYFAVKAFIPKIYKISLKGKSLSAELMGDTFNPDKSKIKLEIKNVTYHNFKLKKTSKGYKSTVIFDV